MSIATLKKVTQHKYNNSSVRRPQFSLNGTRRSAGWVGQTSLSRSFPRTLVRGAHSHELCRGIYCNNIISGLVDNNDASIVKSSVVGTRGMMETKFRWAKRPFPYSAKKSDTTNNLNIQSEYIKSVIAKTAAENTKCDAANYVNGKYMKLTIPQKTCFGVSRTKSDVVKPDFCGPVAILPSERTQLLRTACIDGSGARFVSSTQNTPMV